MGLEIMTSDNEKSFRIGYFGFSFIRRFFLLHYGTEVHDEYMVLLRNLTFDPEGVFFFTEKFYEKIGDLSILIDHSDCDGELTSEECRKLKPCLFVDEDRIIKSLPDFNKPEKYFPLMYEFIELISYCADNPEVKLIFT